MGRQVSVDPDAIGQRVRRIGALPVVNQVPDRLGFDQAVAAALGPPDPRCTLDPATAIGLLVRNLCLHRRPLYSIGAWAAGYDPAALRLTPGQAAALGDDTFGTALDRLFDADRASLLTRLSLAAIDSFGVCLPRSAIRGVRAHSRAQATLSCEQTTRRAPSHSPS